MFIKKRGQSFQEYAILIALAATAFIAMQAYMKRGVQGRLRDLANQISPKQYEASDTTAKTVIDRDGTSTDKETAAQYETKSSDTTTTTYEATIVEQ
jgi:hypothetical protein